LTQRIPQLQGLAMTAADRVAELDCWRQYSNSNSR